MTGPCPRVPRVAIIGGGPSAIYALKRLIASENPLAITIFEAGERVGVGTPYNRERNSPAMLANIASIELPSVCETLLDWLQRLPAARRRALEIEDKSLCERHFFPRVVLGEYFAAQFTILMDQGAARGHTLTPQTSTTVSDVIAHAGGVWVTSDAAHQSGVHAFDHAILATGHSAPQVRPDATFAVQRSCPVGSAPGTTRLGVLGTSLSAIDVAIDHALRIGTFETEGGDLRFVPTPGGDLSHSPLITMMSRGGLLPEADFFCPIPYEALDLFTRECLAGIVRGDDGDLDQVFALFAAQLERLDPQFLASLGPACTTPEAFADRYAQRRSIFDPFEWAKGNLLEAHYNARHARTVPWRYALLRMHEPFGEIVKHLSPVDRDRFNRSLKRVFVDNYAAVPPLSIQRLLALHEVGVLVISAIGADYAIDWDEINARWCVSARGSRLYFDRIIDARGQAPVGQEEFPFPTLRMQIRAQAIASAESLDEIATGRGFELGQPGNPLERVHCLSLPFLLSRNPFIQGLTAAEELGTSAAHAILTAIAAPQEADGKSRLEEALVSLGGRTIYLFTDNGSLILNAPPFFESGEP